MKTIRKTIDVQSPLARPVGRVDARRLDDTGEAEIDRQRAEDDADALRDAARFARHVRRRLGFSQAEFAARIGVSLDTIRNWEQGKRHPTGAAKALLRVLDKAPEAALVALG
jgi:putative transcriptional regulator